VAIADVPYTQEVVGGGGPITVPKAVDRKSLGHRSSQDRGGPRSSKGKNQPYQPTLRVEIALKKTDPLDGSEVAADVGRGD